MLYSVSALSATAPSSALPRRSSLGHMVNQSTVLLMFSIGSLILLLALLILFHQNAKATVGYQLRNLERERSRLLLQEEVLKMELAQEQSLENIESNQQVQAMILGRDLQYTQNEPTIATTSD